MRPKHLCRRQRANLVANSRWSAYATAGAATALMGVYSAEADITYVDPADVEFNAVGFGGSDYATFTLGASGRKFKPRHQRSITFSTYGAADFFLYNNAGSRGIVGFTTFGSGYASRLVYGQNISTRPFIALNRARMASYAFYHGPGQWNTAGEGYLAFKFFDGVGTAYGWVRFRMDGQPGNSFQLLDYAYGAAGDQVFTGQIPEPGSLGLLAVGAAGLLLWRRQRAKTAAQQ